MVRSCCGWVKIPLGVIEVITVSESGSEEDCNLLSLCASKAKKYIRIATLGVALETTYLDAIIFSVPSFGDK
jgi:hypothetical protein